MAGKRFHDPVILRPWGSAQEWAEVSLFGYSVENKERYFAEFVLSEAEGLRMTGEKAAWLGKGFMVLSF